MLIRPIVSTRLFASLVVVASLAACASPSTEQAHSQHHMGQPADMAAQGGMMGGSTAAAPGSMPRMDKDAMCAMYRRMRDASDEQARQAIMDKQMPGMSPEMRQKHMAMMQQQCQ